MISNTKLFVIPERLYRGSILTFNKNGSPLRNVAGMAFYNVVISIIRQ